MTTRLNTRSEGGVVSTPVPDTPPGGPVGTPAGTSTFPRTLLLLVGVATAVIAVIGIRELAWLLGPVLLALVMTITAQPLRTVLDRHVPRWLSFTLCLLAVYGVVIVFVVILVIALAQFAGLVHDYGNVMDQRVADLSNHLKSLGLSSSDVDHLKSSIGSSRLLDLVRSTLNATLGVLSALALMLSVVFFMVIDAGRFPYRLAAVGPLRPSLVGAMHEFAQSTRRYLVVSSVFGLIVAVLDTVALWLMGVPAPLLWGVLSFITNYIPNIGFFIGLLPPAILALLVSGPKLMLAVIAVYCILNLIIQSGIQPKVVGDTVGLATTITFLSVVFWTWVIGPIGAIMAVPLSLMVRAFLVDADPQAAWLRSLVANEPLPDDVRAEGSEKPRRPARGRSRGQSLGRTRRRTTKAAPAPAVEDSPGD
jgi:AI-2 transport protein TqsA